ncbi:HHE domain-containing protein [Coniochaeta hoffmannii]|uniref:HHE domain-containing protein n=1 Tax=Coniochaeta hoffmannii TaxID=91930 RepID=A0AA38RSB8_9PEZI|nr:HHE domain-containing protein [Coniochaeta hoffmannii]
MGRVSDVIIHDHNELKTYYDKIMNSADLETQTEFQNQFVWELARHSIAEEIVVYPAMEKHVPNGKDMAEKDRQEHRAVKEKLYEFQGMKAGEPDFKPTLKSLWDDLRQHIKEEEQDDLPALEKAIAASASDSLANSFERTKMFVPTRSHPSAPDRPPFETAMGLLAAPMDRLMDMFRKFPDPEKK